MRLSCNGCRVLRKGCSEDCSIRPCLQWIKSPEAQANATVFLAKFYGRAGLMNLVNAPGAPDNLRPAIFRSLLYEACGRIVNPIYGSVGLLWSNNWQMCQAAVEAVLNGKPIVQVSSEAAAANQTPPLKAYDIRHVSKSNLGTTPNNKADGVHKVAKASRATFKRASSASSKHKPSKPRAEVEEPDRGHIHEQEEEEEEQQQQAAFQRAPSHESSDSHDGHRSAAELEPHLQEPSVDTDAEAGSHVSQADAEHSTALATENADEVEKEEELGLELTLGFAPVAARVTHPAGGGHQSGWSAAGETGYIGLRFL